DGVLTGGTDPAKKPAEPAPGRPAPAPVAAAPQPDAPRPDLRAILDSAPAATARAPEPVPEPAPEPPRAAPRPVPVPDERELSDPAAWWEALVERLPLEGVVRNLARNCVLVS